MQGLFKKYPTSVNKINLYSYSELVERESTEVWITQKRKRKGKLLSKKLKDFQMKVTHKHTEASLIRFDNHRCLSQSEECKCMWTHS